MTRRRVGPEHIDDDRVKMCERCGELFLPHYGNDDVTRFCSAGCYDAALAQRRARPKVVVACAYCGRPSLPSRADVRYCSIRCRTAAHRLRSRKRLTERRGADSPDA